MATTLTYLKTAPEKWTPARYANAAKGEKKEDHWKRREQTTTDRIKFMPPGAEVPLNRIRIRATKVYCAVRFSDADGCHSIVLHRNDENQYALLGGACIPLATAQETLMRYLREQLCIRFHSEPLERYLLATLQKRNFSRLVGGGTLYVPAVNEHGFVEYTAYVVIDVPNHAIVPLIARSGGVLRVFDGAFYPPFTAPAHRDLLIPLLRMRMKVFRPPYCLPDPSFADPAPYVVQ